jgi:RNA-directed DNA polymerase
VMHEPEKSGALVVAGKPTNKAERSVAEPVEPRACPRESGGPRPRGTRINQSTRRAQDRASVSQALERVRQAARQGKKERFTSLLHHVDPGMLRTAFYAMKRDAAPGVDGATWETYEKDLDARLRLRPLGRTLATARGHRRHDHGQVCRRPRRGLPA